jgi:NADPH-dependent ferric siderophore reductase
MLGGMAPARSPRVAEVVETIALSPSLVRIIFAGPGLDGFAAGPFTDHYVKLMFPQGDYDIPFDPAAIRAERPKAEWPVVRTYTVRHWDPIRAELTIDFVVHGDEGVAGPWAAGARPGDRLQLMGPGGAYAPSADADWHLFVGDASVLPAIGASLARVRSGVPARVFVELENFADAQDFVTAADLDVNWVRAGGLVDALADAEWPEGEVHAFVHGEATSVREVRRHLVVDRAVPREAISVSGYWKRQRTEDGWRDDKAEWNRLVEADAAAA